MALVKVKPTSPGRRVAGQGRQPEPAQGRPVAPLVESQKTRLGPQQQRPHHDAPQGRRPQAALPHRRLPAQQGRHRRRRSSASSTTRTAARTSRCCSTPTASAATSSRRKGVAVGHAAHVGRGSADQAGQHAAAAQHPGRHDDPLRRDACPARARSSRARPAPSVQLLAREGDLRAAAAALGRDPQGARRLPRDDRRSRQRRAQPALDRQGGRASAGAACARRCAASR